MAYITQEAFDQAISEIHEQHTLDSTNLANAIANLQVGTDLTNYYNITQVDAKVADALSEENVIAAIKKWVEAENAILYEEHIKDVTALANAIDQLSTGGEVNLTNYYTKAEADAKFAAGSGSSNVDLTNYWTIAQTQSYVNTSISGLSGGNVDLTNYYTRSQVDAAINGAVGSIQGAASTYSATINGTTAVVIDSWPLASIRSADYTVTTSNAESVNISKMTVIHNDTAVYSDVYSSIGAGSTGSFTVRIIGTIVEVIFTPSSSATELKWVRETAANTRPTGGTGGTDVTFPLDLQTDSIASIDLMSGTGVIDLQTGENTATFA